MTNNTNIRGFIENLLKNNVSYPLYNEAVAIKLAGLGSAGVEPLIKILSKGSGFGVQHAAIALAVIGDRRAIGPLREELNRPIAPLGDVYDIAAQSSTPDNAHNLAVSMAYQLKEVFISALARLDAIETKDDLNKYLDIEITSSSAANALYKFGERRLALKYILEGLKPFNSIFSKPQGLESRASSAYYCAELKIEEAIDHLFEYLVDLRSYGIESLAIINGFKVIERAKEMSSLPDICGLYAMYLRGLLKDEALIDTFGDMLKNFAKYVEKYDIDERTMAGRAFIRDILGNYSTDVAKNYFYKEILSYKPEDRISYYLFNYHEYNVCLRTLGSCSRSKLGRDIVINHGWDKYLMTDLYSKAFGAAFVPSKWDVEEDGPIDLRKKLSDEVVGKIMEEISLAG